MIKEVNLVDKKTGGNISEDLNTNLIVNTSK